MSESFYKAGDRVKMTPRGVAHIGGNSSRWPDRERGVVVGNPWGGLVRVLKNGQKNSSLYSCAFWVLDNAVAESAAPQNKDLKAENGRLKAALELIGSGLLFYRPKGPLETVVVLNREIEGIREHAKKVLLGCEE
jgi:hypothetical protein